METQYVITGTTEDQVWEQIKTDLAKEENEFDYDVVIDYQGHKIALDIDIDLGGGFESGYATTSFTAELPDHNDFKFALHEEHFMDEVGKFFGMQDIKVGYPELDDHLVIKTNDQTKVKAIFTDASVRSVFEKLNNFDMGIHIHDMEGSEDKHAFLELNIEDADNKPETLKEIYHAFYTVLISI